MGITGRLTFQEEQFGEEDGKDPSGEGDRLCESRHRGCQAAAQQQGEADKGHLEVENFQKQSETFNCAYILQHVTVMYFPYRSHRWKYCYCSQWKAWNDWDFM